MIDEEPPHVRLLLKHLQVCIAHLKADYQEKQLPAWLERAEGVAKIVAESYPSTSLPPSS